MSLLRRFFRAVSFSAVAGLVASCASDALPAIPLINPPEYQPSEADAVPIAVPGRPDSFFAGIPSDVLAMMENGTPSDLRAAASRLRRPTQQYSRAEAVALNIICGIFSLAWRGESVDFEAPALGEETVYTGAIESAANGIYDTSTGNSDFFSLVLPSLVLFSPSTRTDYFPQAEQALSAALELNGQSVLVHYLLALLLYAQGQYDAAAGHIASARNSAPSLYPLESLLVRCLARGGNDGEALALAENLLRVRPDDVEMLAVCADIAVRRADWASAENYVSRILQHEPENGRYVLLRARILIERGDFIRAASLLDVYSRADGTARDYLLLRARLQQQWNRNMGAAVATMEKAVSLYPDDRDVIMAAASLAAEANASIAGQSSADLSGKILADDASNIEALRIRAAGLVRDRDWQRAYTANSRILEQGAADQSDRLRHVDICLALGRTDEAFSLAQRLYGAAPGSESVAQAYIRVLVAQRKNAEASALIQSLLPSASSQMRSFLHYERSFLVSSEEDVLAALHASLTAYLRNRDALFRMYSLYFGKKDYRKAQYYLKQVLSIDSSEEMLRLNAQLEQLLKK